MSQALERSVRAYVAEGSDLDPHVVIPGNSSGQRPIMPYSSVLLINDIRKSYPIRKQLTHGQTIDLIYRRATFSVQWYRRGCRGSGRGVRYVGDVGEWTDAGRDRFRRWQDRSPAPSQGRIWLHFRTRGRLQRSRWRWGDGGCERGAWGGGGPGPDQLRRRLCDTASTLTFRGGGGSGAEATAQGVGFRIVFPANDTAPG